MKITGLITEYNPFHNGHAYHLERARELTGADTVIAVMSGNFVQRGEPAIVDKYARTRMAVSAGVDAVFELPVVYATASAERFAAGAVGLLAGLGVTDIVYGTECPESEHGKLRELAALFVEEPEDYKSALSTALGAGLSFPAARERAVATIVPELAKYLKTPNNILGIEYEKALIKYSAHGMPAASHIIRRSGKEHYETGSAIRRALMADSPDLDGLVPDTTKKELGYSVFLDDFSELLFYRLSIAMAEELTDYPDVSAELSGRIMRCYGKAHSFSELVGMAAARNFPESRIRRALLHILLGIHKEAGTDSMPSFARVLGFRESSPTMKLLKKSTHLPIVTKLADAPASYELDARASEIYNRIVFARHGLCLPDDYRAKIVIRK